ncbi:MAG TPA: ATP-binding protein [Myxococcota bacterium]|nr:ATP-binding protein [Myxococcota bacterium]
MNASGLVAGLAVAAVGGLALATAAMLHPAAGIVVLLLGAFVVAQIVTRLRSLEQQAVADLAAHLAAEPTIQGVEVALAALLGEVALAERRARRNEDLRDALFENAPGGVVLVGRGLRVLAANPGIRELLPVVGDPIGRRLGDAVPFEPLVKTIQDALDKGTSTFREARSGRFDLLLRAAPVGGTGAVAVVVDVSPFRRAARARSDFVANVSHELRTPVTSISGYAETLLDHEGLDDDGRVMAEAIHRNARRLTLIFAELLQLARLEAGDEELELEERSIAETLGPLLDEAREVARERRVNIHRSGDALALIHPEAFGRVVGNLLANAVNFSPDGGEVRVVVRPDGEHVWLEIHDRGPGIDPEHIERIFERFFRIDRGRARQYGGTGLGLALVKHLCMRTRAEVSVRSDPGHGATFFVRFPAP